MTTLLEQNSHSPSQFQLHSPVEGAIAIHQYDVVVVGGGIAGIAIAEFLSRKTNLRIRLIDRQEKLGTGASGKLEGWFHAGALYSGNDDHAVFMNCVNSIQDLIDFYSSHFANRCNMVLSEKRPNFYAPAIDAAPQNEKWFNDSHVFYLLPNTESPEIRLSKLKNDRVLWQIQRQRVLNRLEATFGLEYNWLQGGKCKAPLIENIEKFSAGTSSLLEPSKPLEELCLRYDSTFGIKSHYEVLKSMDVSMNTSAIMRDLISSAISNGVHFETRVTIENLVIDATGAHIKSLLCRDRNGMQEHLKAKLFVFAVGSGFETLLKQLHMHVKLTINKSAMVLASPPLSPINFARMSPKSKFHFNHFAQEGTSDAGIFKYSILANSRFWRDHIDWREHVGPEQIANDTDGLLETAERYFGEEMLYARSLYSYECFKTEFISDEEEKRRYSYWIEFGKNTNYISVLPGKFSFFPTVAYQTYLKIKDFLDAKEVSERDRFQSDEKIAEVAKKLLADHHALKVLASNASKISSPFGPKKKMLVAQRNLS